MIISCPQCHTKYRLSQEKVKPEGARVRCSRCRHEFLTVPEDDLSAIFWSGEGKDEGSSQEVKSDQDRFSDALADEDQAEPGGGRSWARPLLLLLILALLLGAGGYMYWPQLTAWMPFLSSQSRTDIELGRKVEESSLTEDIALKDVRQYMVDNQSMGRILVIEGRVMNTSETARRNIKVQATLFEDQGRSLISQEFLCGNTASLYQLQHLNQEELQGVLSSQAGILANNSHLAPQQDVAFMTFFPQFPEEVAEFSLKVVQAKEAQTSRDET